jgi:hypothetical protein
VQISIAGKPLTMRMIIDNKTRRLSIFQNTGSKRFKKKSNFGKEL